MKEKSDLLVWVVAGVILLIPALSVVFRFLHLFPYLPGAVFWLRGALVVVGLAIFYLWMLVVPKLSSQRGRGERHGRTR